MDFPLLTPLVRDLQVKNTIAHIHSKSVILGICYFSLLDSINEHLFLPLNIIVMSYISIARYAKRPRKKSLISIKL